MKRKLVLFLWFICALTYAQTSSLDFNYGWQFRQVGTETWYPATVPGTVHTDLLANGLIEDPFKDNNEIEQQWIENENWEYKNVFSLDGEMYNYKHHEFNFEGLDTYAEVYFNDSLILEANNMFRSWRVDVTGMLNEDENVLHIIFTSPINKNDSLARNHIKLPAGSDTTEFPVGPFTRKAAYHFGWDFAPRFVTSGIWKNIELQFWDEFVLRDVYYQTEDISLETALIYLDYKFETSVSAVARVEVNGKTFYDTIQAGSSWQELDIEIDRPKLWWPNGSGKQHLYDANLVVYNQQDTLARDIQKIGLRTIELVNEPDSIGTSFYFKVNDVPLFMKGANYVPQDVFLPRVKREDYVRLLTQVKDAGMNMLRVWGGGVYERDIFYDLCDEYGILVWQDFMFAGGLYPYKITNELFETTLQEVEEQIFRLRKHSCLALWCGNNEIEVAWKNWGWQKQYGYSTNDSLELWMDYANLFQTSIPAIANTLNPETPYVSTSPQSNWGTPENFNHGSMHYWGVWHGDNVFSDYEKNVGRFMVEWGFQSFPDYDLLANYISSENLHLDNDVMRNRQKSYVGNSKIIEFMIAEFPVSTLETFKSFILKSQQVQAVGYTQAIKSHLNAQPHCMGTLLWQLNDCWPGPSWSIINYDGKPKPVYEKVMVVFNQ